VIDGAPEDGAAPGAAAGHVTGSNEFERAEPLERLVDQAAADVAEEEVPDLFSGEAVGRSLQRLVDAIGNASKTDYRECWGAGAGSWRRRGCGSGLDSGSYGAGFTERLPIIIRHSYGCLFRVVSIRNERSMSGPIRQRALQPSARVHATRC
jgi:hypothetical protein